MKNFKSFIQSNEIDIIDEAESHQSKTTMKYVNNPNAAEKKAAKDIKPGIKGVKDRLAMLRAAKDRGALKEDDLDEAKSGYYSLSDKEKESGTFQKSHATQLAAAQAEIDRRRNKGEDMKGARIDRNTYKVVKPKKRVMTKEEAEELDELSTKTLAKAAKSASDPDSDYSYGKSHDPQKFADHAKKTKDAKSAAAVQGAADAKGHYPRPGHTVGGSDTLAYRTKSRITATGKANKQDVKALKGKIQSRNEDVDVEMLLNLYDNLDESNQEIFLNQLEEDAEVLLAFAKTIAKE